MRLIRFIYEFEINKLPPSLSLNQQS